VRLWCERALLNRAPGDPAEAGVVLTIEGATIAAVDTGVAAPPPGAEVLSGLTLPGFVNAHSHAFHRALRGRTHGGAGGTFWSWRDRMYELAARLDPDGYEALATAAYAEMVLAGYTAVGEFHYLHHAPGGARYGDPNELGHRLVGAARRAGLRITLLDTCYLHAGPGRDAEGVQRRFSDGTADAWAERVAALADSAADDAVAVGAAIHSARAIDPPAIAAVAAWASSRDAVLHAHVSEQQRENDECLAAYGCTPVQLLADHGALGERFTAVHATHLAPDDIALLGGGRCRCCLCPTTERDLADGIGPAGALRAAGAGLCIGSDSHAVVDPFEETRAVELDERLATGRRGTHPAGQLLWDATAEGAASLGWRAGVLQPGWLADLVTIGLDGPRLAGTGDDLAAAAVFAASAADVRHVFVGGRHVVADGVHRTIDVAAALDRSIAAVWGAA